MDIPEDFSRWARNERLYNLLVGKGLVVYQIPSSIRENGIEFMLVSSDQIDVKNSRLSGTLGGVVSPIQGS